MDLSKKYFFLNANNTVSNLENYKNGLYIKFLTEIFKKINFNFQIHNRGEFVNIK